MSSKLHHLLKQIDQALLLQQWITVDKRPERTEEWLNILIKKNAGLDMLFSIAEIPTHQEQLKFLKHIQQILQSGTFYFDL